MYLFELEFGLYICPGLMDYMVALFLVFRGNSIVFSTVATPTYILEWVLSDWDFFIIMLINLHYMNQCYSAQLLSHVQLCDLMHCSPPSSSVHGIFQTGILEWVAISSSRGTSQGRNQIQASQGLNQSLWRPLRWQADSLPLSPQ